MKVSARELKNRTGAVLKHVRAGKSVVITYRGKPMARVVSLQRRGAAKVDEAFGIWADYPETEDVQKFLEKIRGGRFT